MSDKNENQELRAEENLSPSYKTFMPNNCVNPVVSQPIVNGYHCQSNETDSVSQQTDASSDISTDSIIKKTKCGDLCVISGAKNALHFLCTECCLRCCIQGVIVMCITGLCKGGY